MSKRLIITIAAAVLTLASAAAQEYVATPVTISREKVKLDGKVYYTHVVLERQTLYSLSKAYEVSIDEIYDANENIQLRETGLKKNSIILIPAKDGKKVPKKERTVEVQEPVGDTTAAHLPAVDTLVAFIDEFGPVDEPVDTLAAEPEDTVRFVPKDNVNILLMLPLKAGTGRGQSGYMDFYSGALMAARIKGQQGINVNLNVYDVADGIPTLSEETYDKADIVIGPVFPDNMKKLLAAAPADLPVVSPMDARTAELLESNRNLIQAHCSAERQYQDLVDWIARERNEGDEVLVIYESSKAADKAIIEEMLDSAAIGWGEISYNILEGRDIISRFKAKMTATYTNRIIIASESEAFVNDVVRNLSVLTHESSGSYGIILYGQSKLKGYETIEAENYHNTNLHMSLSYNVDYDDARVKDFLMTYRGIFRTEPTAFSYQGYDLTYFFITEIAKYGDNWYDWFTSEEGRMLQASFRFEKENEETGHENTALRHIVYGPEYSIQVID